MRTVGCNDSEDPNYGKEVILATDGIANRILNETLIPQGDILARIRAACIRLLSDPDKKQIRVEDRKTVLQAC